MKEKIRLAIFDMDGTILDTLEDLQDSLNYCLAKKGYPLRTYEEVRGFVGNGIRKLIERAVPVGTSVETVDEIQQMFMPYYEEHCADKTKPYDGIVELLTELKKEGMITAVVSNKAHEAVLELCEQYFAGLFDIAVGEQKGMAQKPAPDSVYYVLKELGYSKDDAVYIGDSEVDLETAVNSGLTPYIVTWGFRDEMFLREKGAKIIVSSAKELFELLVKQ